MHTTELDRETKKASEPAKRWRNRYLANPGCPFTPGLTGEHFGRKVFPSKDSAETAALRHMQQRGCICDHIGAFPVSE